MGPPALDKSSNTLPLSLAVTYQQKGERPIDDVFTYEIVKVLPPGFDADFLKSSRTKAKIMDHKTRIKGIDVGMGQETNKNIEVLLLPRDQISDIENDRLRFYVFFYASWKVYFPPEPGQPVKVDNLSSLR
jgi:hypothetical protein